MDILAALRAISPLDGRYQHQLVDLQDYFSEYAFFKYRLHVEVEYLIALSGLGLAPIPSINQAAQNQLRAWVNDFSVEDAAAIKDYEKTTNHDVKALEYFFHTYLKNQGNDNLQAWVHFGLTSQDINNTAIPLSLKAFIYNLYLPLCQQLITELAEAVEAWADIPMLARTHGQPASPTRLGKEIAVFLTRLHKQLQRLSTLEWEGKFGGATGNFNAHHVAFPSVDWPTFATSFLHSLGLERQPITSQVEHYDGLAEFFEVISRINTILLDFCRDMWGYIALHYFQLSLKAGEVGSSAMPHKVNPIDFENAEGNLGVANALLGHFAAKLPVSRWQRDLSDSTVLRNVGVPLGHSVLALKSTVRGLQKCAPNLPVIREDLLKNAVVVAEAYQVILRREGISDGYERLKSLTRNHHQPTLGDLHRFVETLPVSEAVKKELLAITPENYTGINLISGL